MLSTRHRAHVFVADSIPVLPTGHRPEHHPPGESLRFCSLYGPRKEETPFADSRLNALALCVLQGLGIRHAVVGAWSAMEASDSKEELAARAVEHSELFHAESPRRIPRAAASPFPWTLSCTPSA